MPSISDANPNLYKSIHVLKDDEKNKLRHRLQLDSLLFPTKSDFIKLCETAAGDNRAGKIENLRVFDTDIYFATKLNRDRIRDFESKERLCLLIPDSSDATRRLHDLFHENLTALCEVSGIQLPIQKSTSIEDAYNKINRMLVDAEITNEGNIVQDESLKPRDVLVEIEDAEFHYDNTDAKDAANEILKQILEIEQTHYADDQLVSKIESQIKWVEKLPVQQLELQLERLIKEITPFGLSHNRTLFGDVRKLVTRTCAAMKKEIDTFLTDYTEKHEHELISDLDKTIDSLIKKAESFRKDWEHEFSRFFTSDDQCNAKRQRIV